MANVFDNAVKGYTIGLNNKLNAQKAYINSYLDGINARNAVNQEARTQDQYYNYTQPLQASNLGVIVGKNNIDTGILTNPDYIKNIQGYEWDNATKQYKLGHADIDNLANYIETQKQNSNTGLNNSKIAALGSAEALSLLPMSQKLSRNALVAALGRQPTELEFAKFTAEQNLENAKNPTTTQIFGANPNGTPTTIMLQNSGTPSIDKPWTSRYLNPAVTTPASGLPSNQSNTQQTGQQQVPTGYENKYQYDERIRKENILKSVDTYQKLLDLAIQNGRKDDIAKYSGLLQATKNSLNNPLPNLYDRIFNNQSEADNNYQLNKRKLLGQ